MYICIYVYVYCKPTDIRNQTDRWVDKQTDRHFYAYIWGFPTSRVPFGGLHNTDHGILKSMFGSSFVKGSCHISY